MNWLQYYLDLIGRAHGQSALPFSSALPPAVSKSILTQPVHVEGEGFPGGVGVPFPDRTGEEGNTPRLSQEMMFLDMLRRGEFAMPDAYAPSPYENQFGPKYPQAPGASESWPFAMY